MSDNPMMLVVSFKDEQSAENVRQILQAAQDWIFAEPEEERYLGSYISKEKKAKRIRFSSCWVPSGKIERSAESLKFECVGSPGDDWPDDLLVWLGRQKAARAKGTLTISGTGDVIEIDESFK